VGTFENDTVTLDKSGLIDQLDSYKNEHLQLCPLYERDKIKQRIEDLPEKLNPEKDANRWVMGYHIENGKPAWVFPKDDIWIPYGITTRLIEKEKSEDVTSRISPRQSTGISFGVQISSSEEHSLSVRHIPPTRYTDVCGQDQALEQVRDYAELPLKHSDLFKQVGVKPGKGILLWGPPGNGKTLLARAVAGESSSHIETISGPETLSKWVGESEKNLREIFERAAHYAPSVIIMDEVDSLAGNRESDNLGYLRQVVSQLLVLMDGLSDLGRVLIIATTNCPDHIDSAILRPGRIDRKIFMGLPDKRGRGAIWKKYLIRMSVDEGISLDALANLTDGFSGAEIEHAASEAGLLAIKDSIKNETPAESVKISKENFIRSIDQIRTSSQTTPQTKTIQHNLQTTFLQGRRKKTGNMATILDVPGTFRNHPKIPTAPGYFYLRGTLSGNALHCPKCKSPLFQPI
jgi:AAA+ superfamily predicted ATPase